MTAVAELWTELVGIYAVTFTSQYGLVGGEGFKLWARKLEGVSSKRMQYGLKRLEEIGSEWRPNPNHFKSLCKPKPEHFGIKDCYSAYVEACHASKKMKPKWSHECVRVAAANTGHFFLGGSPESKALPVFKRNFEITVNKFLSGEQISKPIPKGLERKEPEQPKTTKAQVAEARMGIRRILKLERGGE